MKENMRQKINCRGGKIIDEEDVHVEFEDIDDRDDVKIIDRIESDLMKSMFC